MKTNSDHIADAVTILHLSDLHFGNHNRYQNWNLSNFGLEFSRAVVEACSEESWNSGVNIIVVSGDIAEVARPKEFALGNAFLQALTHGLDLSTERVVFVPGNHDLSWPECKKIDAEREIDWFEDDEYEQRIRASKFKHYIKFLQDFYGWPSPSLDHMTNCTFLDKENGAYIRDFIIDGLPISFASLNTCESENHVRAGGELGSESAQKLIAAWCQELYKPCIKVAIVHHNPSASGPENIEWGKEWAAKMIREGALQPGEDWLRHYTADMAGFKGAELLRRVVKESDAHLVLHGHHHNPSAPILWKRKGPGAAPVLSVGSFGLNSNQIPNDQPLTCQLIRFQREPVPRLSAVPLEFDPNYYLEGSVDKGQFKLNHKSESVYTDSFDLPIAWKVNDRHRAELTSGLSTALNLDSFAAAYRLRLQPLFSSYDLKNLAVVPSEIEKISNPQLDSLYLPLRFFERFSVNVTNWGRDLDLDVLAKLMIGPQKGDFESKEFELYRLMPSRKFGRALSITGAAGTGKTTWVRYTFRRMIEDDRFLPIFVELRSVAKYWSENAKDKHSIEAYIEYWLREKVPAFQDSGLKLDNILDCHEPWRPVVIVDGWDELGDYGVQFREKLLGMMRHYKSLFVMALLHECCEYEELIGFLCEQKEDQPTLGKVSLQKEVLSYPQLARV